MAPIYTSVTQFGEVTQVFILFQFFPYGRVKLSQAIWESAKEQPEWRLEITLYEMNIKYNHHILLPVVYCQPQK